MYEYDLKTPAAPAINPADYTLKNIKTVLNSDGAITASWDQPSVTMTKYKTCKYADGKYDNRTEIRSGTSYTMPADEGKSYHFKTSEAH